MSADETNKYTSQCLQIQENWKYYHTANCEIWKLSGNVILKYNSTIKYATTFPINIVPLEVTQLKIYFHILYIEDCDLRIHSNSKLNNM
jgi:hypothetical protein